MDPVRLKCDWELLVLLAPDGTAPTAVLLQSASQLLTRSASLRVLQVTPTPLAQCLQQCTCRAKCMLPTQVGHLKTHLDPDWRALAAAPSLPATADHWRLLVGLLPWLAELTGVTGTSRLLR